MGPPATPIQLSELTGLENVRVEENAEPLEWMENPWEGVARAGEWLLHLAEWFGPDIVHLNGYAHANLAWRFPVLVVAHSCVATWWRAVYGRDAGAEWNVYRGQVARGLKAADAIVTPSYDMASGIKEQYGLETGRVEVIYNSSSLAAKPKAEKQSFCLAAGRFWDEAKNLDLLLQIAPHLSWPVCIAGSNSGPALSTSNVHYLGQLDRADYLDHAGRASIFLHPAVYEPFGLAVLEAARNGCALVLSDIGSLRELWQDSAVFVPPRDPNLWVHAIRSLLADKAMRTEMGRTALERSIKYSETGHVQAYLKKYQLLTSKCESGASVTAGC